MWRHLTYLYVLFSLALSGCSSGQHGLFDFLQVRDFDDHRVEISHPGGPIQNPEVPEELSREAMNSPALHRLSRGKITYSVKYNFTDENLDDQIRKDLSKTFEKNSLLEKLRKSTDVDFPALEQRTRSDLDNARDVLHSYGFYDGEVSGQTVLLPPKNEGEKSRRAQVTINFTPGQRYLLGKSTIQVLSDSGDELGSDDGSLDGSNSEDNAEQPEGRRRQVPKSLADVGLAEGTPVVADAVLEAVEAVRGSFRSTGYPYAEISSARYFLDRELHVLECEIQVESGEKVLMGDLELRGLSPVYPKYFDSMKIWRSGQVWNQNRIDFFRENLRQTGLFASVDVYPSENLNERGERNVVVEVVGALERTVGGAVRYDSDLGMGVLGYWEHRNISGRGDKLRFEAPIWSEMQELALSYRLPFFKQRGQDLIVNGGVLHEDNDSYKLFTAGGAIGVERRLGRHWSATARVSGEGGDIEEVNKKERQYYMFGLPLSLTFNDTPNPLDATKGMRITLSSSPYGGYYEDYFSALRTRLDTNFFLRLTETDKLVLALRGVYGGLFFADSPEVPPTIRFYSGGGGSVRGYDFRSVGPRDEDDNPLGGDSLLELSAELRWKLTEDWGLVLFTDGGMVYTDKLPNKDDDLLWGAGVGLRYYTMLGPVRFDVAFPINKRDDDSAVQLYISIGQSF